jgi:CheY-like chemotaxis protein
MKKVLVIDDDQEYNFITEVTFEDCGVDCELIFKGNAKDAMEYLKQNEFPDIIFLDINMPVTNGWEFLEEYEASNYHKDKKTIIVMTSSSCYQEDKDKAKQYHKVVDFIEKPISCDDIHRVMNYKEEG